MAGIGVITIAKYLTNLNNVVAADYLGLGKLFYRSTRSTPKLMDKIPHFLKTNQYRRILVL